MSSEEPSEMNMMNMTGSHNGPANIINNSVKAVTHVNIDRDPCECAPRVGVENEFN